jgi:hypothetical protein
MQTLNPSCNTRPLRWHIQTILKTSSAEIAQMTTQYKFRRNTLAAVVPVIVLVANPRQRSRQSLFLYFWLPVCYHVANEGMNQAKGLVDQDCKGPAIRKCAATSFPPHNFWSTKATGEHSTRPIHLVAQVVQVDQPYFRFRNRL